MGASPLTCSRSVLAGLVLLASSLAYAQGGPPLITDDTHTPGNGNWEINVGVVADRRPAVREYQVPQLDMNYGYGQHLQFTYLLPWIIRGEDGTATRSGLGDSLFGVKWCFFDNEKHGIQLSTYPQLEVNNPNQSADRGLVDRGVRFLLPVEVVKSVGPVEVNGEVGHWFTQYGPDQWIFGLAFGYQATHRLELLSEIYDFKTSDPAEADTTFDFGGRLKLKGPLLLIFMAGRSFHGAGSGQSQFIGYLGMQFLFSTRHKAPPAP